MKVDHARRTSPNLSNAFCRSGLLVGGVVLVVIVVALLEGVAVLLEIEVVEECSENRDIALAETLSCTLHDVARRLPAVNAQDDPLGLRPHPNDIRPPHDPRRLHHPNR